MKFTEGNNPDERCRSRILECKSSREKVIREVEKVVSTMPKRRSNSPTGSSLKGKTNRTTDRRSGKQRRTDPVGNLATGTGTIAERYSRST